MNSNDIVIKTAKGVAEVEARSKKLPQRLRTILIMIDGTLTAGQLLERAVKMGVPSDFLDSLQKEGLVEARSTGSQAAAEAVATVTTASDADRFRAAQKFMNDTVVDALGMRAFMFTLKLERCFTCAELNDLMDAYVKAITKGSGDEVAAVLKLRAQELLG
jgi:hypothetical protein